MKATLKYTLPEEQAEYMQAVHGGDWESAMWGLRQAIERMINREGVSDTEHEVLSRVLERLNECIADNGVKFSP